MSVLGITESIFRVPYNSEGRKALSELRLIGIGKGKASHVKTKPTIALICGQIDMVLL
jgi:hypothetical protein